ncbi:hypothetical protein XELAEV_180050997mg, partial [Xenopus laevis]
EKERILRCKRPKRKSLKPPR